MKKGIGITCAIIGGVALIAGIAGCVITANRKKREQESLPPNDFLDDVVKDSTKTFYTEAVKQYD